MLKTLRLSNIVLVESAEIAFDNGLNILSGETGSGKSAVMEALSQLAGARADPNLVRYGADKGVVEAAFDIENNPEILALLKASGIDHAVEEDLCIRREIGAAGKSRAFVNNQLAQVGLLKNLATLLMEIVGQHANQRLLHPDQHRDIIDIFGDLVPLRQSFAKSWEKEAEMRRSLSALIDEESQRLREIDTLRQEVQELENANVQEKEEETLFAEYTRLTHSEELATACRNIHETLSGENGSLLSRLKQLQRSFEQLERLDPHLAEPSGIFRSALIELDEVARLINNYNAGIEFQPERITDINDRMSLLHRIKRKYGQTFQEVYAYHQKAKERLHTLEQADVQIEDLQKKLTVVEKENNVLSLELSKKRMEATKKLEKAIIGQIRSLNMPKADFSVAVTPQARTRDGDDRVEFFFAPNVGEKKVSVIDCASGGELSRLMLAVQTVLAGKGNVRTLVFDEIDANIGGETAKIVGQKLEEIGKQHQVLCITHFPQVAQYAHHHLQITKKEKSGRTFTEIETLDIKKREKELSRMAGKGV